MSLPISSVLVLPGERAPATDIIIIIVIIIIIQSSVHSINTNNRHQFTVSRSHGRTTTEHVPAVW